MLHHHLQEGEGCECEIKKCFICLKDDSLFLEHVHDKHPAGENAEHDASPAALGSGHDAHQASPEAHAAAEPHAEEHPAEHAAGGEEEHHAVATKATNPSVKGTRAKSLENQVRMCVYVFLLFVWMEFCLSIVHFSTMCA
jgi:hypothetical protein